MEPTVNDEALRQLGRAVEQRRRELNLRQDQLAHGPSTTTMTQIEAGAAVSALSYRRVEQSLAWASGSCATILGGGDPVIAHPITSGPVQPSDSAESVPVLIGRARVTFAGPAVDYDDVQLLPGGALRVATIGWASGPATHMDRFPQPDRPYETDVRIYPPGSWSDVRPLDLRGTLVVLDEPDEDDIRVAIDGGADPTRVVATLVTENSARLEAVAYLVRSYGMEHAQAVDVAGRAFEPNQPIRVQCKDFGGFQYRRMAFTLIRAAGE